MRTLLALAALAPLCAMTSLSALPATAQTAQAGMPQPASPVRALPANAVPAVALPCARTCMEGLADRFLKALATRNPQALPLAGTSRYTEMGQELALGDGLWGTASDVGAYRHVFSDPQSGQIGLFATLKENGRPLVMGARLKVELGRISEMEVVVYRSGSGPAWNDNGVLELDKMARPEALWTTATPAGQRLSRQELVAIADSYFESLQNNDGKKQYPFTDDCDRLENGVHTTNNPGMVRMGDIDIGGMGCRQQFETGLYGVVTRIHQRRFPVVDEERQIVFALGVFDHAGTIHELTMPDGRKVSTGTFNKPSSILITEGFKISGRRIQRVEAVGASVPYHLYAGWGER